MVSFRQNLLRFKTWFQPHTEWLDRHTAGAYSVLVIAIRQFTLETGSEAAASLAFYAIFSLFPLLALFVTFASLFLGAKQVSDLLVRILYPVFPASISLITDIIQRFVEHPVTISAWSSVGLFWAASAAFAILVNNINKAWQGARPRNFLQQRLLGLTLIAIILALLVIMLLFSTGVDLLSRIDPDLFRLYAFNTIWQIGIKIFTIVVTFFIFLLIYRYTPSAPVRYREAFWGALLVTLAWEIISAVFSWFIGRSQGSYSMLFGSLAAVAVLMLWLYFNNLMILFGAHISAAIAVHRKLQEEPVIKVPEEQHRNT